MKQENITPKVIELARQIAERWRMEVYEGCWYLYTTTNPLDEKDKDSDLKFHYSREKILPEQQKEKLCNDIFCGEYTPIPDILDIEAKLEELQWHVYFCVEHIQGIDHYYLPSIWEIHIRNNLNYKKEIKKSSSSHLEALLSALLEVLRNNAK